MSTSVLVKMTLASTFAMMAAGENSVAQSCWRWQQLFPGHLQPAMCYDSLRERTVLYGSSGDFSATWEWDGQRWHRYEDNSPGIRIRHAMAFDSIRGRTVLFGGFGLIHDRSTWEWDGEQWLLVSAEGPPSRNAHTMAFDSSRGVTVLYGGDVHNGNPVETWEWNGQIWSLRDTNGPGPRFKAGMVYDEVRKVLVLYGGGGSPDSQHWEWNGERWTNRDVQGPGSRRGHSMVFDTTRGVTILYGGITDSEEIGPWEFDGVQWTLSSAGTDPGLYYDGGSSYHAATQTMLMFGGLTAPVPDSLVGAQLWGLKSNQWTSVHIGSPGSGDMRAAYDSNAHQTFLVGNFGSGLSSQTWVWDQATWKRLSAPNNMSLCSRRPDIAFDENRKLMVSLGNTSASEGCEPRTWEWVNGAWSLVSIAGPACRDYALTFDSARDESVLYTGIDWESGYVSHTWAWNGETWRLKSTSGPPSRERTAIAYDQRRKRAILFGGRDTTTEQYLNDTWEWDGARWTKVEASGPAASIDHALVYDSARGVIVLVGGFGVGGNIADVWEWNGADWRQRPINDGPAPYTSSAVSYNPAGNKITAVGFSTTHELIPTKVGDLNCDDGVNVLDLLLIIGNWGQCPNAPTFCAADLAPLGGDGVVDILDLLMVIENWR